MDDNLNVEDLQTSLSIGTQQQPLCVYGKTYYQRTPSIRGAQRFSVVGSIPFDFAPWMYDALLVDLNEKINTILQTVPGTLFGPFVAEVMKCVYDQLHTICVIFYIR